MTEILDLRRLAGLKQSELARAAGTSQPAIAAYEAGRKSPTLSTVRRLARSVGLEATVTYATPMTREERRSLHLHRAIAERLKSDPERTVSKARLNLERMQSGASGVSQPLREWGVLLDRPLEALVEILTDPSPWARELRHVTPFAGVLMPAERAEAYRAFADEEERRR
ncbi:MAG: helix-turn-helix domain-containing protein [Longimicrobiales bacterium]|nr:helix-turn-helix domain-containing protein [Longimicrobiales bacterium]